MQTTKTRARFIDRETAREMLTKKAEHAREQIGDPKAFSTVDPAVILRDAEHRLRWIDCAPAGANHQVAPLQDKTGTPMGGAFYEAPQVSAGRALREARIRRGLHPITGARAA